jgi:hypothetical protein
MSMKSPVVAQCPDCQQQGVLCCSACGLCANCALHEDCSQVNETVHNPGGSADGSEDSGSNGGS